MIFSPSLSEGKALIGGFFFFFGLAMIINS